MGKLTISMAIFNSYVSLPEGMVNHSAWFSTKNNHHVKTFGFHVSMGFNGFKEKIGKSNPNIVAFVSAFRHLWTGLGIQCIHIIHIYHTHLKVFYCDFHHQDMVKINFLLVQIGLGRFGIPSIIKLTCC